MDSKIIRNDLEQIFEKIYNKDYFKDWVKNFGLNLNDIWNESSAEILKNNQKLTEKSAIVIGRGPSVKKNKHLETLVNSSYEGVIVCCDGMLISALESGITPDRFPDFYVVTIDGAEKISKFYDHKVVKRFGNKIKGIFSTVSNPKTVSIARDAGIKIHWVK